MELGILTLLPMVVLFTLIFTTKRVIMALTAATLTGAILLGGPAFAGVWLETFMETFMEGTLGWLLILLGLFGILIAILDASGSVTEFAEWLTRYANTRRKTLLITFILGLIVFIDDYLNNMAISTAMKKVADSHKIPRVLLGYTVNATAATTCILVPISTWAVFYAMLFEEDGVLIDGSGMKAYIAAIPFMFYAWIMLIVLFLVVIGVIPLIGLVKKHTRIAEETGVVCLTEVNMDGKEIVSAPYAADESKSPKPWNFLIPILVLVVATLLSEIDIMIGCMAGIGASGILLLAQRKMTICQLFDNAYSGVANMLMVSVMLAVSFLLVGINTATGLPEFVVEMLAPYLSGPMFPAIVFGFCAVYSYFGGGFWDMSLVFMPIIVPLSVAVGVDPIMPCAALVSASVAGSSTCVVGDAVMITSRALDIRPYYQMLGTLPYAIISYVAAVICHIIAGFMFI